MPQPLDIETPALLINESVALHNISSFQQHCTQAGLALRPHIKTHKSLHFADAQRAAGATGITCQKISEAEVMSAAGHDDILITYNILGDSKLKRLKALAKKIRKLTVTADNAVVIRGLASTFKNSDLTINVLIECDSGGARCGVQTAEEAVALAIQINDAPALNFDGLMTFPSPNGEPSGLIQQIIDALNAVGIECTTVSTGGTPNMWHAQTHDIFTEYRAGTYIFNDRSLLERGTCTEDQCAAHVIATVVSTPSADRAVIDAGSKTLTSDLFGLQHHGHIIGHTGSTIATLSEEHGVIRVAADDSFTVGEQVRIIPNHICVVINMFDQVWLEKAAGNIETLKIDARGCVI